MMIPRFLNLPISAYKGNFNAKTDKNINLIGKKLPMPLQYRKLLTEFQVTLYFEPETIPVLAGDMEEAEQLALNEWNFQGINPRIGELDVEDF